MAGVMVGSSPSVGRLDQSAIADPGPSVDDAADDSTALADLPFDQYSRHLAVRQVADLVRAHDGRRRLLVLDVGGYPCLLPRFLGPDRVVVVDPTPDGDVEYLRASGLALPFLDDSFDLVVSLDSLEHVAADDRPRYLSELLRVARGYVLVLAPFRSAETERAEALLSEYIKLVLHAEHAQLREHRECGLPDLAATTAALSVHGAAATTFPSGYLYHWLPLMLLKHQLLSIDPAAGGHAALDRWYNARGARFDGREPAYRHGVLVSKAGNTAVLDLALARLAAAAVGAEEDLLARQDLQIVLHLLALERANRGPAPLEERLAHRERQIADLTREVETLRAHLAAIRQGRVMRAMNAVRQALGQGGA